MANYTMKDIPEDLFEKMKLRADNNKRSLNAQIQWDMAKLTEEDKKE